MVKKESVRPQLIDYDNDPEQFGVLRLPKSKGPHPLVILIHGGMRLASNDLDYMNPIGSALADAGIAAWNIEYRRLGNSGGFPTTFEDVARAVDHVRTFASANNLDLQRVVMLGHSAGAPLALWCAARERIPPKSVLHATAKNMLKVRAVITLAGVLDLNAAAEQNLGDGVVPKLLGGTRAKYPERYAATSPMEMLPLGVPQVLIHGTEDNLVPFQMSKDYQTAAKARGDDVQLIPLRGANHFASVDPRTREWEQVSKIIQAFF